MGQLAVAENPCEYRKSLGRDFIAVLSRFHRFKWAGSSTLDEAQYAPLKKLINENLLTRLGERVIAAWPLGAAPKPSQLHGSFASGLAVLTSARLIVEYFDRWRALHREGGTEHSSLRIGVSHLNSTRLIVVTGSKAEESQRNVRFVGDRLNSRFVCMKLTFRY